MSRVVSDCREMPSENNCSIVIAGEEDEVLELATWHAVSAHGHEDTPEFRKDVRKMLKPETPEVWSPTGRIDSPEARH